MQRFRGRCRSGLSTQAVPALCRCTGRAEDGRITEFVSILALDPQSSSGCPSAALWLSSSFAGTAARCGALFLAGAYAGWAGSLPPETVQSRLRLSLEASRLAASEFVSALLSSMFSTNARRTASPSSPPVLRRAITRPDSVRSLGRRPRRISATCCPRLVYPR